MALCRFIPTKKGSELLEIPTSKNHVSTKSPRNFLRSLCGSHAYENFITAQVALTGRLAVGSKTPIKAAQNPYAARPKNAKIIIVGYLICDSH